MAAVWFGARKDDGGGDAEGITFGRTFGIGSHARAEVGTETLFDIAHVNRSGNAIGRKREPKRARALVSPRPKY